MTTMSILSVTLLAAPVSSTLTKLQNGSDSITGQMGFLQQTLDDVVAFNISNTKLGPMEQFIRGLPRGMIFNGVPVSEILDFLTLADNPQDSPIFGQVESTLLTARSSALTVHNNVDTVRTYSKTFLDVQ
jgi:hypothetical protein